MKTKHTKYIIALIVATFLRLAAKAETGQEAATQSIVQSHVDIYNRILDDITSDFLQKGKIPATAQVLKVLEFENRLQAFHLSTPSVTIPPLILTNHIKAVDINAIPMQIIIERCRLAGLDLKKDRIEGREIVLKKQ